ncbi:MAG: hypothetical protein ACF8QF_02220 [Phycisphaerales bacterium]
MRTIAIAACALCCSAAATADLNADVRAAVDANTRPLTVAEASLAGAGGAWLLAEAAASKFVMLGESHLNAETPAFTRALLYELAGDGFGVYVTETGPETTRLLVDSIESGGLDAAEALLSRNPFSIAFLDHREELRVVADGLDLGYRVWGVDQEFIGSPRGLLARLVAIAPNDDARALAQAALDRALAGFARFAQAGDQSQAFMVTTNDAELDALGEAFTGVGEAKDIIEQLRASAAVYRAYNEQRYYDNNSTRIDLMKRNLLQHIERTGWTPLDMPKAVFKAGTYHMGKGHTPVHVLDLGNFAHEVAIASGERSFHIVILAAASTNAAGETRAWADSAPHLVPLFEQVAGDPVAIDLRPLRAVLTQSGNKTAAHEDLQRLALAFDAAVIFPMFTPADGLYSMPGR